MAMRMNEMAPAAGSKHNRLRVGRGASAGQGKTCGRGVKGQRARKGGYHKVGFEGGQMPLQRRLPKVGFRSGLKSTRAEVRLSELAKVEGTVIDLAAAEGCRCGAEACRSGQGGALGRHHPRRDPEGHRCDQGCAGRDCRSRRHGRGG